jgi:hypothetical protein
MCIVKKHNIDLKRQFVSSHCVATLKSTNLVDLCLFSGEGKPTLLGGYVLSPKEAFQLGKSLVNFSAWLESANPEEKKQIINENIVMVYQILKDINNEQAQKLKELFDIKIIKKEQKDMGHEYIG